MSNDPNYVSNGAPRISIWYLLIWMFCCGILISVFMKFDSIPFVPLEQTIPSEEWVRITKVVYAILLSAFLSAFLLLVGSRLTNSSVRFSQPGHFMLAAESVRCLLTLSFMIGTWYESLYESDFRIVMLYLMVALTELVIATIYAFGVRQSGERFWQWLLILFAAAALLFAYSGFLAVRQILQENIEPWPEWLLTARSWAPMVLFAGTIWLVVADIAMRKKRDWIHWVGATYVIFAATVPVAIYFVSTLSTNSP